MTVAAGLLAAMLVAPGLWFHHPFFGPLPPLALIPTLPAVTDTVLFALLVLLLPLIAFLPQPRLAILGFCAVFALKAATDVSVWQPYFYQYVAMLLVLQQLFARARSVSDAAVIGALRLIVIAVYFWSGLNKFNYRFFSAGLEALPGLEELLSPLRALVDPRAFAFVSGVVPFVETGIALGLLLPALRRGAAVVAIAMHVLLLLSLGPLGRDLNEIVWPWNVAMILFVGLLFLRRDGASAATILWNAGARWHQVVFGFFVVGPLLGLFGYWPSGLSLKLYSFRFAAGDIYVTEALRGQLPADVQKELQPVSVYFDVGRDKGAKVGPYVAGVNIADWSERALNAFVPLETRVYEQVFARVCTLAPAPSDAVLLIVAPPDVRTGAAGQSVTICPPR